MQQVLLIGLDGFDPVLAQQWMDDGCLPVLKSLSNQGFFAPLSSTIPAFTYPAWSSMLTGVNPGRHGIIDFAVRSPGSYSVNYINSTHRLQPTIFSRLSAAGKRVVAMGFPTTYPPEPVNGIMLSGFDSPLAYDADRSFCYPPSIWKELRHNGSAYTLAGIQELHIGPGWHKKAETAIRNTIASRTALAEYLIKKENWDLFSIVFSESDTAAHHFWAAFDERSPRHAEFSGEHSGFLLEVYRMLDSAVGRLIREAKPNAHVLVVSDHGSGGSGNSLISLNRILEQNGFFRYREKPWVARSGKVDNLTESRLNTNWTRRMARHLPARLGQWLFRYGPRNIVESMESRNRLSGADLNHCLAFSDELNYFPSIWLHDSRFPLGRSFSAPERESLLQAIQASLNNYRHPDTGNCILSAVHRREDIYHGSAVECLPDLVLELNLEDNYSYSIWNPGCSGSPIEILPASGRIGYKGGSMNGSHRPHGVVISNRSRRTTSPEPSIVDIGVTVLALLGLDTSSWMPDGIDLFDDPVAQQLANQKKPGNPLLPKQIEYSQAEAATIAARLKRLGYL
ncbi:alkaline phosphatase family protein [bacterium]|nr:alkaline phosphatase family protein [candidate division CSSED10-310 bacterium]